MSSPTPETLRALLGREQAMPPPDARVIESTDADGHVRILLDYATAGGDRVQAFLLLPGDRPDPCPGILAIHQDGALRPYAVGKSEPAGTGGDPELAYGLELCRRGYAVICPDRLGFESRRLAVSAAADRFERFGLVAMLDGAGPPLDLTEDLYRGWVANWLHFAGWTMLGQELAECRRAVDVLAARPEVDPSRLGVIGHSAGGLLAAYAMYLDGRLGVGCASCGTWRLGDAFRPHAPRPMQGFGTFAAVPGMATWGDTDDVLAGLAPRPWFEAAGDCSPDALPPEATRLVAKAAARYRALGAAERFAWLASGGGHAFPRPERARAYAWFDRWLGLDSDPVATGP